LEGASTSLKCHADGVPQPTTEWQVGQYKVPHDTQRYEWSSKLYSYTGNNISH